MKKTTLTLLGFLLIVCSCLTPEVDQRPLDDEIITTVHLKATEYSAVEIDRCSDDFDEFNFWWYDSSIPFREQFFASSESEPLTFTEYDDGTANIKGTTLGTRRNCEVTVDVWLKDKKSWEEWEASGGEFKDESADGACSGAKAEDMYYYVIDGDRSFMTSSGTECSSAGTYRLIQRPDPNDPDTPNLGVVVGPGGANWDARDAIGLATWAWVTDIDTGERLWNVDFTFLLDCDGTIEENTSTDVLKTE